MSPDRHIKDKAKSMAMDDELAGASSVQEESKKEEAMEEEEGEAIGPRSSGWAMVVRAACSNALQVPLWHCSLLLLLFFKTYHGRG